jgi:hypothetical protein
VHIAEEYTIIAEDIFKISKDILCVLVVDLFGEIAYSRMNERNHNEKNNVVNYVEQFNHLVDNCMCLSLEKFIFTLFNGNGFKTIVIKRQQYNVFIILNKTMKNIKIVSLLKYVFTKLIKEAEV